MPVPSSEWETWGNDLEATSNEAGGVWNAYAFRPPDKTSLMLAAAYGDAFAELALNVIDTVTSGVRSAPRKAPIRCMCCPRAIRHGPWYAIAMVAPSRPDASRSIGAAVCERCAADEAMLTGKIIAAMRELMPDARAISDPALHKPGHAYMGHKAYLAKPTRSRTLAAAPPLPPGARLPTAAEQREMTIALDQMLADEQRLREHGHIPTFPPLYSALAVEVMDAVVEGRPFSPDQFFHVLDMFDAHHRMAQAADQGMHRYHAERQALRNLAEAQDEAA